MERTPRLSFFKNYVIYLIHQKYHSCEYVLLTMKPYKIGAQGIKKKAKYLITLWILRLQSKARFSF